MGSWVSMLIQRYKISWNHDAWRLMIFLFFIVMIRKSLILIFNRPLANPNNKCLF